MSGLFDLTGKVALVTGGANGMGRMIAEGLVAAGAEVIVTSRKADEAEEAAQALGGRGIAADVGAPGGADALARTVTGMDGPLHVVINNAGKTFGAPFGGFPQKGWPGVMAVNVEAPFMLVQGLAEKLQASAQPDDPARVINIGSIAGLRVEDIPAYSYAASKAAIHHLSRVLALELADRAITVNTLVPGYFPTKMTAHIRADDAANAALEARVPMGRLGQPGDIAGAAVFLASRAAAYVTGSEIVVDGGLALGG